MFPPNLRGLGRPLLLYLCFVCHFLIKTDAQQYSFTRDCIDQHHKEVKCFVQLVDCDDDSLLPDRVNNTQQIPDEAHDIRVEPFAKSISRRQAESYQLSVDISWQTPPNNSTKLLKGFFLEIESDDQKTRLCFLFNVSESNWTAQTISNSPRLHFSTESLFRFGQKYDVAVHSLPESTAVTKITRKRVVMPQNPRMTNFTNLLSPNCSQYSHPYASKWTAGFRRIILHSLARTIQIEFVGAPAQYCFESYEVRLLDESGLELLHSDIISVEQMNSERIDNNTVYFGQYNFTNLELDKSYIPSVIAVERAADGRCLCPVYGTNPYDNTVVCSCIAADWKAVKLQKINAANPVVVNSTIPLTASESTESSGSAVYVALVCLIAAILGCVIFLLFNVYRYYGARGKTVRIRFIQDRNEQSSSHHGYDGQGKSLLESGDVSTTILLNDKLNLNLLIIYSHDSIEHDAAVLALADFLRDVFNFDVHLDAYDADKIEQNLMDYLSSSVINADKILIINSMGSAQRYQTKIQSVPGSCFIIERNEPTTFDSLFTQQIDMALQHHSIISARFDFSQFNEVLVPLHGCLQYVLPSNLAPLVSALTSSNLKNDTRLTGFHPTLQRLTTTVEAQKKLITTNPNWFTHSHHRRRIAARESNVGLAQIPVLPSMSTLPTLSVGDEEEIESRVIPEVETTENIEAALIQLDNQSITESATESCNNEETEQVVVEPVNARTVIELVNDPNDSGVYDDCRLDSTSRMQTMNEQFAEERTRLESVGENEQEIVVAQTHLPPTSRIEGKWQRDENLDSGMISDADIQMISAT